MTWLNDRAIIEGGWMTYCKKMNVFVITTLRGDINFFSNDKNPDNPYWFAFASLLSLLKIIESHTIILYI
jgi:hypothetical protein